MSRNTNANYEVLPKIEVDRSIFDIETEVKTTFNVGDLIPLCAPIDVIPGSTHEIDITKVLRLTPMVNSPYDNLYMDTYWFFVPYRLVWDKFKAFMGEQESAPWKDEVNYSIPQIKIPQGGWAEGTIADYFGIPTKRNADGNDTINALPFRAYAMIYEQYFRDQNLMTPLYIPKDNATVQGENVIPQYVNAYKGGKPLKACKSHDLFTSCLPSPQRGEDVTITGLAKVWNVTTAETEVESDYPMFMKAINGEQFAVGTKHQILGMGDGTDSVATNIVSTSYTSSGQNNEAYPTNLVVDMRTIGPNGLTINNIREAFALQRYYEALARAGNRYTEYLKGIYGVTSEDARIQRVEYLGGHRTPINISQVLQTSEGTDTSPLGRVAGYSLTGDSGSEFTKSFTEHGMIIGLGVVRYDHTYQNMLNPIWRLRDREDMYIPQFSNIGEQPILKEQIYYSDSKADNEEVFGYNEAWYMYRHRPSYVSGKMRSNATGSLDSMHFADNYTTSTPHLDEKWIQETPNNVDRVLAVSHTVTDQILMDTRIVDRAVLPMPVYSVPGLLDHN